MTNSGTSALNTHSSPGTVTVENTETKGFFSRLSKSLMKAIDIIPDSAKVTIGPVSEFALALPVGLAVWAGASRTPKLKENAPLLGITAATLISGIGTVLTAALMMKDPAHFRDEPIGKLISKIPGGEKFISWVETANGPVSSAHGEENASVTSTAMTMSNTASISSQQGLAQSEQPAV